jgi:general secretion pathway protein H
MMRARRAGFTLLELLVVIVLIALAISVASLGIGQGLQASRERQALRDMVYALRQTRTAAVLGNTPQSLHFNMAARWYQIPGQPRHSWPERWRVQLTSAHETGSSIAFYPDGSSSGGNLLIAQGERKWRIDIAWLTGDVRSKALP